MSRRLVTILVACIILIMGGGVSYSVYQSQNEELISSASKDLGEAREIFKETLTRVFKPATVVYQTVADSGITHADETAITDLFSGSVIGAIREYEQIDGVFLGFTDGRFYHIQTLSLPGDVMISASKQDLLPLRRRIIDDPWRNNRGRWERYNPSARRWLAEELETPSYDPRLRPWYKAAVAEAGPIWTNAYVFASSQKLGVSFARPIYDNDGELFAVLGVDLSLESLSHTLLQSTSVLSELGDVVFATDLTDRILGHPDYVRSAGALTTTAQEFFSKYQDEGSVENTLIQSTDMLDIVEIVNRNGRDLLVTKTKLDAAIAMPLQIYLARNMSVVLAGATQSLQRNVALLFGAIVVFGIVIFYAVKMRVEVAARQKAEMELIEAKEVAEAATAAKSTFLATMSHEIRTPMNGVMSMAELLTLTRLDAEQRRMAKIINDSANALLTIINDILDFSKIEAGKLDIETIEMSLLDVVNGSAELLAPKAEDKGLELIVDIDPGLTDRRMGDPTRIRQIILNLGSNAVKFTDAGEITIVAKATGSSDRLRFEVSDSGIGLSEEQQGKLFQAFVQADSSTSRKYGGTGLGLSICQRLCELMGGDIGVESVAGEGSTFWFELPMPAGDESPPSYPGDLSTAEVVLVGLHRRAAGIARKYLEAGGVTSISEHGQLPEMMDTNNALWIMEASVDGLKERLDELSGTLALLGTRSDVSELDPILKSRASIILTRPLSRPPLWRAAAIHLGLEDADEIEVELRDDLAYAPPSVEEARAQGCCILVAEDNSTNQVVIRQMLSRMGFACEIADNGVKALEIFEPEAHGLLLTDFNMPEMDGFELTRTIRAAEIEGERLPVIALTADALAGTEEACYEAGMDGYLTKPIDSRKLGSMLVKHLPKALDLRRSEAELDLGDPTGSDAASDGLAVDWDTGIFDPERLGADLGGIDNEMKELIRDASEAWTGKVADIKAAFEEGDLKKARDVAHSLKGAALSIGADRLGNIASDIQDALDTDDEMMAKMMVNVLQPTLDEFQQLVPKITGEA